MSDSAITPSFLTADRDTSPVTHFTSPADVVEAMLQSVQGGELHLRPALTAGEDDAFRVYIEIGQALRLCLPDPVRRDYLIARLKPFAGLIIGVLPAGLMGAGVLPGAPVEGTEAGLRPLEQIGDDELRQWIIDDGRLIYGEFKRYELENYFAAIAPLVQPGGKMIDMGSGLGKVVMSAALSLPFAECIGIELLPYRHRMACERLEKMLAIGARGLAAIAQNEADQTAAADALAKLKARITIIEQDMFKADVSNASLIFIYSTCFAPLMPALADKLAREMREHSLVSTTTFQLRHPAFQLVRHFPAQTAAWTDIYVYERIGALESLPPPDAPYVYEPDRELWEANARRELANLK